MANEIRGPYYVLVMNFSLDKAGFEEKLFLGSTTASAALALANQMVTLRLSCLPTTVDLDWARISNIGPPRDGRAVLGNYPVPGNYTVTPTGTPPAVPVPAVTPNLYSDAIMYRCETDEGPWTNRWVRGIPDQQIEADAITKVITQPGAPIMDPGAPGFPTDFEGLVGNYLKAVQVNTMFYQQRVNGAQLIRFTMPIVAVIVRGVRSKKTGRPFALPRGRAIAR
jgi:hypothetical protein